MYSIDDYRSRFTLKGLTITEETRDDGLEGFRIRGQRQGREVNTFIAFEDIEMYLAKLGRVN